MQSDCVLSLRDVSALLGDARVAPCESLDDYDDMNAWECVAGFDMAIAPRISHAGNLKPVEFTTRHEPRNRGELRARFEHRLY